MKKELYLKHRPKSLAEVIGQKSTIKMLQSFIKKDKVPHALLFTGPSGCGKTTLARILRRKIGCGKFDFKELDCADFRGIDMVRNIRSHIQQVPIDGKCRVWLIDECHKMTNEAQNAFLKMLEDTPSHVYFMLATTDPNKLMRTIKTRCTEVTVKNLSDTDMFKVLDRVAIAENIDISKNIISKIFECSGGSARQALVLLNQISGLEDEKDMETILEDASAKEKGEFIGKLLLNPNCKWKKIAAALRAAKDQEAEIIRWGVLGWMKAVLISNSPLSNRAYIIINAFRDNFYDSKHAGLAAACYECSVIS